MRSRALLGAAAALAAATLRAAAPETAPRDLTEHQRLAREIFEQLIEIDTTHSSGDTTAAAKAMAARLLEAGFVEDDIHVIEPAPRKGNLVARLRSPAPVGKPVLLLAHLDVVEAHPDDWSTPPFELVVRDGYFYGRGTVDDKDEAAIAIANMIRWKREGYRPQRDIIVALTADEEGGPHNGVEHLLAEHRALVDAEFVINEGGGGVIRDGARTALLVQAAEKVYQSFTFEATNRGGHSSVPRQDNAIYQLSRALLRIADHRFPVMLNEVTRGYFRALAAARGGEEGDAMLGLVREPRDPRSVARFENDPVYNAQLRTTCVATRLEAGHAENALPQRARATVNCRMLPGHAPEGLQAELVRVIDDPGVSVMPVEPARPGPASLLPDEVMSPIVRVTETMWPGVHVVPTMSTGATDGKYFREAGIPAYGVSGIFGDADDVRSHGRDERILVQAFFDGLEFADRLVRAYTSP